MDDGSAIPRLKRKAR